MVRLQKKHIKFITKRCKGLAELFVMIVFGLIVSGYASASSNNSVPKSYNPHFDKKPALIQFDNGYWVVSNNFKFFIGEKDSLGNQPYIEIPKGFVTDLASIPWYVKWFFSDKSAHAQAAILHDYMYWVNPCSEEIGKRVADKIFLQALKSINISRFEAKLMKKAVAINSEKNVWDINKQKRRAGESHFIPIRLWPIVPKHKWNNAFISQHPFDQREFETPIGEHVFRNLDVCGIFKWNNK